ncbi:MAG: malonate transporter subunit MadL [Gammaproteobacteria bacterium]|nr:malonate transporter subunit MadL [Gammaproteobacteria bacterium]
MLIYGVALLSVCMVVGLTVGEYLGRWLGVDANVGGVGIAMLLLVASCSSSRMSSLVNGPAGEGIRFWSAMYIPIVVAMAARQNIFAAIQSGALAIAAGTAAVVVCFALVPVICRLGGAPRDASGKR